MQIVLLKKDYPKMQMIVVSWQRILLRQKWKYIYSQSMSKDGIVYLLMILNVNIYANVILLNVPYAQMLLVILNVNIYANVILLNVPYAQMKVMLVLTRACWP